MWFETAENAAPAWARAPRLAAAAMLAAALLCGGPARAEPAPGAAASHLKLPTGEERAQFHNELVRNGWQSARLAFIPSGYELINGRVTPLPGHVATVYGDVTGDGQPEWVAGYYFPSESGEAPLAAMEGLPVRRAPQNQARLVVFKRDGAGQWRFHWRSPELGVQFSPPQHNFWDVEQGLEGVSSLHLPLALVDVNGDKRMEILYHCWSDSRVVGSLPGLYRFDGSRWVSVAPQADRFSVRDVNGDGKLEVITGSRYIGSGMGDDDVPRVWRWNGRQYQEASAEYPLFYEHLAQRYQTYVRRMEAQGRDFNRAAWQRAIQKAVSLAG